MAKLYAETWITCEIDADFAKDEKEFSVHFIFDGKWRFCKASLYEVLEGYIYCKQWSKEVYFIDNLKAFDPYRRNW